MIKNYRVLPSRALVTLKLYANINAFLKWVNNTLVISLTDPLPTHNSSFKLLSIKLKLIKNDFP